MSARADASAVALRRRLADLLRADGDLRTAPWRHAVERVPRERFLGGRVYRRVDGPGGTLWEPVTPAEVGQARWLELAYENTTWVTQLDGRYREDAQPTQGTPTSSSTLPGLVVSMLEDLAVDDGDRVLEVGTGTGYSTALLCRRLGDDLVTSIEIDPSIAARAAQALGAAGYAPTLAIGDGLRGHRARAPYDRIIATCSVRTVPATWLAQTSTGGRILVTLSGWLYGSGLVTLEVTGGGHAHGRFLPGTVSFMPARAHAAPPLSDLPARGGEQRPARYGPGILDDWMGRFLAQLAAPTASRRMRVTDGNGGQAAELLFDHATGSYAWLSPVGEGWTVTQDGPVRLWDRIEQTVSAWHDADGPAQHEFTLTISPDTQTVHLPTSGTSLTWTLPPQGNRRLDGHRRRRPPRPAR
ncbi:ATP-grasp peptide maturase system methyltransferase [Streptosporangium sp. NPDC006007]|uniref:ATP-grasp peptide maturase system methyltransferase n=1 Tax=Streptosporangium sp. NPDC006007 TaxID=3154575 RepID=UPI0033BF93EA